MPSLYYLIDSSYESPAPSYCIVHEKVDFQRSLADAILTDQIRYPDSVNIGYAGQLCFDPDSDLPPVSLEDQSLINEVSLRDFVQPVWAAALARHGQSEIPFPEVDNVEDIKNVKKA